MGELSQKQQKTTLAWAVSQRLNPIAYASLIFTRKRCEVFFRKDRLFFAERERERER